MAAIVTNKFRIFAAEQFRESLSEGTDNLYLAIGRQMVWGSPDSPIAPLDADYSDRRDSDLMIAAKKIDGEDMSMVIPRINWINGTIYKQYDDTDSDLFGVGNQIYCVTDDLHVYKCIWNNFNSPSTIKPTGTLTTIITTADGYRWKYMFTVAGSDAIKFMTNNWVPIKRVTNNLDSQYANQWAVQEAAVEGTVDTIIIEEEGSGYNIGTTTIVITGDGVGAAATPIISTINGAIIGVTVTNAGSGYSYVNVTLVDSGAPAGSGGVLRGVIAPKGGHGKSAYQELGANFVMCSTKLSFDEGGDFTTSASFRVLNLLLNPNEYSGSIASQDTYDLATKLNVGSVVGAFVPGEIVQVDANNYGYFIDYNAVSHNMRINSIRGTIGVGATLVGQTSGATAIVGTITNPELAYNSGDILYREYRTPVDRSPTQSEQIALVVEF